MTALAFHLEAPPRLRCGHREKIDLPFLGEVTARCWRAAEPGADLCPDHERARRAMRFVERIKTETSAFLDDLGYPRIDPQPYPAVEYLCPARTSPLTRCLTPLPCERHNVPNHVAGEIIHGSTFLRAAGARRVINATKEADQ